MLLDINVIRDTEVNCPIEHVYFNTYSSRIDSIFPPLRYAFYKGFAAAIQDIALKKLSSCRYRVSISNNLERYNYSITVKCGLIRYELPSYKEGKLLTNTKTVLASEIEKKYRVKLS